MFTVNDIVLPQFFLLFRLPVGVGFKKSVLFPLFAVVRITVSDKALNHDAVVQPDRQIEQRIYFDG